MKYGRKPKLTDSTIRDLTSALSIGATIDIACAYAGVSTSSYYNWMRAGESALRKFEDDPGVRLSKREEKYLRFYDEVEKTKAYAAIGWLQVVNESASRDPSYALKMLKMRYPDGFSEIQKSEVAGPGGGPIQTEDVNETRERLLAELQEIVEEDECRETPGVDRGS